MQGCYDTPSQLPPSLPASANSPAPFSHTAAIVLSDTLHSTAPEASPSVPALTSPPRLVESVMLISGDTVVARSPLWTRTGHQDCSANNNNSSNSTSSQDNRPHNSSSCYTTQREDRRSFLPLSPSAASTAVTSPPQTIAGLSGAVPFSPSQTAAVRGVAAKEVGCVLLRAGQATACCICLWSHDDEQQSVHTAECVQLCCGHEFHVDCLQRWLLRSSLCPVCRSEL